MSKRVANRTGPGRNKGGRNVRRAELQRREARKLEKRKALGLGHEIAAGVRQGINDVL